MPRTLGRKSLSAFLALLAAPAPGTAQLVLFKPAPPPVAAFIPKDTLVLRPRGEAKFEGLARLSWRQDKLTVEGEYRRMGTAPGAATLEVYAFAPPVPVAPARKGGRPPPVAPAQGTRVWSTTLPLQGATTPFTIPFETFAPVGPKAKPSGADLQASLGSKPIGSLGAVGKAAKPLSAMNLHRKAFAQAVGLAGKTKVLAATRLAAGQDVPYFLRVVGADGLPGPAAVVELFEPMPPPLRTTLEICVNRGTPEFPEKRWGTAMGWGPGYPDSVELRFTSVVPDAAKAWLSVVAGEFPADPRHWDQPDGELVRLPMPLPGKDGAGASMVNLAAIPDAPGKTARTYRARLVLVRGNGALAGLPSAPVTFTVPAAPPATAKADPDLVFETDLVGYIPAHLAHPNDAYRFVTVKPVPAEHVENLKKLTGKGELPVGTKVYMPPQPAPEEKSWWDKVQTVLATMADFIDSVAKLMIYVFESIVPALIDDVSVEGLALIPGIDRKDAEAAIGGFNAAKGYAFWALGAPKMLLDKAQDAIANEVLDGVDCSAIERLDLRKKVHGAIRGWVNEHSALPGKSKHYLYPDPDFQEHPAVVFLRVRAKGPTDKLGRPFPTEVVIRSLSGRADLLGVPPQWCELFRKSVSFPTMAGGETITVPVVLDYHWTQKAQPTLWRDNVMHSQKGLIQLGAKSIEKPLGSAWSLE